MRHPSLAPPGLAAKDSAPATRRGKPEKATTAASTHTLSGFAKRRYIPADHHDAYQRHEARDEHTGAYGATLVRRLMIPYHTHIIVDDFVPTSGGGWKAEYQSGYFLQGTQPHPPHLTHTSPAHWKDDWTMTLIGISWMPIIHPGFH